MFCLPSGIRWCRSRAGGWRGMRQGQTNPNHGQGCPYHTGARRRHPPGARTPRRAFPACRAGLPCAAQALPGRDRSPQRSASPWLAGEPRHHGHARHHPGAQHQHRKPWVSGCLLPPSNRRNSLIIHGVAGEEHLPRVNNAAGRPCAADAGFAFPAS